MRRLRATLLLLPPAAIVAVPSLKRLAGSVLAELDSSASGTDVGVVARGGPVDAGGGGGSSSRRGSAAGLQAD